MRKYNFLHSIPLYTAGIKQATFMWNATFISFSVERALCYSEINIHKTTFILILKLFIKKKLFAPKATALCFYLTLCAQGCSTY